MATEIRELKARDEPDEQTEAGSDEMSDQPSHLEIDREWDRDSAMGDMSHISSTMSVTSSIYDNVIENGRTYHRFKEGKYLLPNDVKEQDRLDYQHRLFCQVNDGKLYLAPIGQNPQNVLDIGTGTGIWAIEFGLEHPGAHVVGTDLSPIQPDYAPPNVSFEICDAEDDWSFSTSFDLIHMRAMITAFREPLRVFRSAFAALAPGGYIELRDPLLPFHFKTPPPPDCALASWGAQLMDAARRMGRDWGLAASYADMLRGIGFEGVVERREAIALSPWPRGQENKQLSLLLQHDVLNVLEPMSMALFTRVLGWEADKLKELLEAVKRDVCDTRIHAYSEG
ncbi:S-adenosyl-L-methionine-dependent methyltransferase [Xylariaceae sp. FL0016]|nr:S-adenosyl-L-methionine-dependent methyltransferase [Xylariaceae sp. FL0016]